MKYSNEEDNTNTYLNYLVGATFLMLMVQIYRSKHTKGGSSNTGTSSTNKKGGFGGGGGMSDMMGMGKSNV